MSSKGKWMKTPSLQSSYGFKLGLVVISPECEGLPAVPTAEEMFWAEAQNLALPSPERIAARHFVSRRLTLPKPAINLDELLSLGLPALPADMQENPPKKTNAAAKKSKKHESLNKTSANFSAADYYGKDEAALSKLLRTTAILIEKIPSQSAADILMDMPSWMRTIFLARHGIPRVVGVLLATRIEEAGESTILSRDGIVEAHNVIAPERKVLDCKIGISREELAGSGLNRLTAPRRGSKPAVTIKNPNLNVQQNPRILVPNKSRVSNLYS